MTLLATVNKKHICDVTLINALSKVIISDIFTSIVVWSGDNKTQSQSQITDILEKILTMLTRLMNP